MQGVDGEREHGLDVLRWVRRLRPTVALALQIAALFHDIDRVVHPQYGGGFKGDRQSTAYVRHKKAHARRSAAFIIPRLRLIGIKPSVLKRVRWLITHHDDPGAEIEQARDRDLSALAAADSLSFFTTIAPKLYAAEGAARFRDKVEFMAAKMSTSMQRQLRTVRLSNRVFERVKNAAIDQLTHVPGSAS